MATRSPSDRPPTTHHPAAETPCVELGRLTSEQLMDRYVGGDAAAFNELYSRHAGQLLGFLMSKTRQRDRAEDLLQTTFVKVHRGRGSYLSGAPLLPWLRAIARRTFYGEQRAPQTRMESLSRDGALPEAATRVPRSRLELPLALRRALSELPAGYRDAILLTKLHGFTGDEAAASLQTTRTAIKLRVHRGTRMLRRSLQPA